MSSDNLLGERLRKLRAEMKQPDVIEDLARKGIEIKQSHISNLESGARLPSLSLLKALAEIYETSTDYLLGVTDDPSSIRQLKQAAAGGGVSGRIGELLGDLSEPARQSLLAIAEAFVNKEVMDVVLGRIAELGGDEALYETAEMLSASRPGATRLLFGRRRLLPPDKSVQQ